MLTDSAEQAKPEMAGFGNICSTLSIQRFTVMDPSASVIVEVQIENEWARKSIRWSFLVQLNRPDKPER
jgi:hypothetical protein